MLAFGLAATPAQYAQAGASDWARTDQTAVRLVSASDGVGQAESLPVGLQFELEPGWKTYWRTPGDAGLPVTVSWEGSENLAGADMSWPAPHRFTLFGLDTFGYEKEVVFPIEVKPQRRGEPVRLRAQVNYLVCETICIPYAAQLALDLPAGPPVPTKFAQLIDRYVARVPGDGTAHGLALESLGIATQGEGQRLEVTARSIFPFESPDLIVEAPAGLYFGAPAVEVTENGHHARLSLPVFTDEGAPPLSEASLTLTLVDGVRGLEQVVTPATGLPVTNGLPPAPLPPIPSGSLAFMLLLALLGGLILNLMPCVLPVLSLKLLGLVGHGGGHMAAVRASFLASAAGVVTMFLVLAGALASLKSAGLAIGWGIQFQQPLFLTAMVLLLTLFACNLWGWFEIPLPAWLGRLGPRDKAAGQQTSLAGSFVTGALATLLATPCSAPFLGTAVGFALAHGLREILAIFGAIGFGLALPYLLVAALPGLATRLPRPGRWMVVLRAALGLALAATSVWLLTILAAQRGPVTALLVAGLMVAAAGAIWARRRLPQELRLASPAAVVLLAAAALLAPGRAPDPQSPAEIDAAGLWQRFDPARIPVLLAEGKRVFVDVTADWCITCEVNKRLVLRDAEVVAVLSAPDIVAMRADWTRPDADIAHYLASFGRYGIPFNAVYGPNSASGVALPELLTKGDVLQALAAAGG